MRHAAPDVSDRPFALPSRELITHVIDLPLPPSVNRIWRAAKAGKRKVSRSPQYRSWIKAADKLVLSMAALRGAKMIRGRFTAVITLALDPAIADNPAADPPFDLDNRHKGVLDYAQSRNLIANDRRCMKLTTEWGHAPCGCRLSLTELST